MTTERKQNQNIFNSQPGKKENKKLNSVFWKGSEKGWMKFGKKIHKYVLS